MKKTETTSTATPKPAAIAARIAELETELAAVEQALAEARDTAAASLLSGADPCELQRTTQALRDKQTATAGALTTLRAAHRDALAAGLADAVRACGVEQQSIQAAYHAAVLDTMRQIAAVLDKLDATATEANNRLGTVRAEAIAGLGVAEGGPEASQFRLPMLGHNGAAEIRRIVFASMR